MGARDSQDLAVCRGGEHLVTAGLVTVRQRPSSAKGTLFLLLEDEWGVVNVICSRNLDLAFGEVIRHAAFLLVYGRVERDGAQINLIAFRFEALESDSVVAHRARDFH